MPQLTSTIMNHCLQAGVLKVIDKAISLSELAGIIDDAANHRSIKKQEIFQVEK